MRTLLALRMAAGSALVASAVMGTVGVPDTDAMKWVFVASGALAAFVYFMIKADDV